MYWASKYHFNWCWRAIVPYVVMVRCFVYFVTGQGYVQILYLTHVCVLTSLTLITVVSLQFFSILNSDDASAPALETQPQGDEEGKRIKKWDEEPKQTNSMYYRDHSPPVCSYYRKAYSLVAALAHAPTGARTADCRPWLTATTICPSDSPKAWHDIHTLCRASKGLRRLQ